MNKLLPLICWLLLFPVWASAQDIPYKFGTITKDELQMTSYQADTSANAIVLNEFALSFIENDTPDFLRMEYYGKIKIFNQKGQNEATISIPLYKSKSNAEEVIGIEAYTYNLVDGEIVKTKLANKDIFRENLSEKYNLVKFTFPQLKDGSVLEYKYILRSPFYFYNFHEWNFQSDIPKIHSEYWAKIPGYFTYKITLRGSLKLSSQSTTLLQGCFDPPGSLFADCNFFKAGMDNIPAMKEEEFMTTLRNYSSRVEFELEEYFNPTTNSKQRFTTTWKDVEKQLLLDSKFGPVFEKSQKFYAQTADVIISSSTDTLEQARKLYTFAQEYFTWNEKYGMLASGDPKDIYEKKTGNAADINLFLTGLLKSKGFDVVPVILSTRQNGYPNTLYPVLTDFNYVIAAVKIGGKNYLLDATEKKTDFGIIPFRCLNKEGRIVDYKKSNWIKLVPDYFDTDQTIVAMTINPKTGVKGKYLNTKFFYKGIDGRKKISSFSSQADYQKSIQDKFTNGTIDSLQIENLGEPKESLTVSYNFEIPEEGTASDKLYIQPFLFDKLESNPLKQFKRSFPIDFGLKKRTINTVKIEIPEGYEIDYLPKGTNFVLPERNGSFKISSEIKENTIIIQSIFQLNEPIYSEAVYQELKELFSLVIKTQNDAVILKKKTSIVKSK